VETGLDKPEVVKESYVVDYTRSTLDVLVKEEIGGNTDRWLYGYQALQVKITSEGTDWWGQDTKQDVLTAYTHHDRLGSIVNLTDQYGRNIARADYREYGEIAFYESITVNGGYRRIAPQLVYTNHEWDDVLDLYYAKARFYDPDEKRFLSMDPVKGSISDPQSLVPYVYCVDNPLRYVDPLGLVSVKTVNTYIADGGGKSTSPSLILHKNVLKTNEANWKSKVPNPVDALIRNTTPHAERNAVDGLSSGSNTPVLSEGPMEKMECPDKPYDAYVGYYGEGEGFDVKALYAGIEFFEISLDSLEAVFGADKDINTMDTKEEVYWGIVLLNAETGVLKFESEEDFVGWGFETVTADAKLGLNTKYVGGEIGGRLVQGSVNVKLIPIPFTDKALSVGATGELFGIGAEAKWTWEDGLTFGVSFLIGGRINLHIVDR